MAIETENKELDNAAVNKKLDELGNCIHTLQHNVEETNKETRENLKTEICDLGQQLQDQDLKLKSIEKSATLMAKQVSRLPAGGGSEQSEKEAAYTQAFSNFLRRKSGSIDESILSDYACEYVQKAYPQFYDNAKQEPNMLTKTILEGVNPAGGYLIRPERLVTMIQRIFETSPLRAYATVITTARNAVQMVVNDQLPASGGWTGEITPVRAETATQQFGLKQIDIKSQYAWPAISEWALDDLGMDVEQLVINGATTRFTLLENKAFIDGNVPLQPRGILTYPDYTTEQKADPNGAYGREAVEQVSSGSAGAFTSDGIKTLQNSLKEFYQPNAIWGLRRKSFAPITELKDNQGRYIFNTRFLQEERTLQLLGQPIVFMNDMPDIATDSLSMFYGDMAPGYTIVDRVGVTVLVDPYTETANGKIIYKMRKRVGADVTNYESFKLQVLSA